jgi:uncharacterized membrane protein (DUF485 family)
MSDLYAKIFADEAFQRMQRKRSHLTWALCALMLGSFYSFILVIAFRPDLLAIPLGPNTVITWGIPVAVSIILLGFVSTGIYVWRANGEFDSTIERIVERVSATD